VSVRDAILVAVLAVARPAVADDTVAGTYDVKVELSVSTCDAKPETLASGKLALTVKKTAVTVRLDKVFPMTGDLKDGVINAKTTKLIGTSMAGLSARYSVTGRAGDGKVDLVLNAQYIRQDTNRPYCAQAWNVAGPKTP
jgi:hypothetical protein